MLEAAGRVADLDRSAQGATVSSPGDAGILSQPITKTDAAHPSPRTILCLGILCERASLIAQIRRYPTMHIHVIEKSNPLSTSRLLLPPRP